MIYRFSGVDYTRIYVLANSLEEAKNKINRKLVWNQIKDNLIIMDFDDLRWNYNRFFQNWFEDKNWDEKSVFIDTNY